MTKPRFTFSKWTSPVSTRSIPISLISAKDVQSVNESFRSCAYRTNGREAAYVLAKRHRESMARVQTDPRVRLVEDVVGRHRNAACVEQRLQTRTCSRVVRITAIRQRAVRPSVDEEEMAAQR